MHCTVRCHRRPNDPGRIDFLDHLPLIDVDLVESAEIAGTHPQIFAIPCQRLWRHRGRRKPLTFFNCWKFQVVSAQHRPARERCKSRVSTARKTRNAGKKNPGGLTRAKLVSRSTTRRFDAAEDSPEMAGEREYQQGEAGSWGKSGARGEC